MWFALIKQYWNLAVFKEKPENTPYSAMLSALISLVFWILIISQWMNADTNHQLTLSIASILAALLLLSYAFFTWVLLRIFRLQSRFLQTYTSLIATHSIIHLLAFPFLLMMPMLLDTPSTIGAFIGVTYLISTLALAIWQFVVAAYIYKHALSSVWLGAILAAVGLLASNLLTLSLW